MTAPAAPQLWRVLAASVAGSGHIERDAPCQDAHRVAVTAAGDLVIAVADGAGSAPRSDEGARVAVDAAVDCAVAAAEGETELDEAAVRAAVAAARDAVHAAAAGDAACDRRDPRDLATTLAVVVAAGDRVLAAQVGDGAVVLQRDGGDLEVLGPVDRAEFLNETCFLTSSGWEDEMRVDVAPAAGLAGVAVMTDGLQLLALDMAAGAAHAGFFAPVFAWAAGGEGSDDELAGFLASERVCARTDDDKTLVVAVPAGGG